GRRGREPGGSLSRRHRDSRGRGVSSGVAQAASRKQTRLRLIGGLFGRAADRRSVKANAGRTFARGIPRRDRQRRIRSRGCQAELHRQQESRHGRGVFHGPAIRRLISLGNSTSEDVAPASGRPTRAAMRLDQIMAGFGGTRPGEGAMAALSTLRARLYFAFGFAAAMTVVGSLIALYTFNDVGSTTTEIVSRSTPAMVQSLRLAEETSGLLAAAPRIMAAQTDAQRNAVAAELKVKEQLLASLVADLIEKTGAPAAEIGRARAAMTERLYTLDQAVAGRISISDQRQKLTLSVRKLHEEFLEQIAPVIDDTNFELVMATRTGLKGASVDLVDLLRRSFEIQAEVNLLAGLLTEASMVGERARLQPIRDQIDAARRKIDANISAMSGIPQRQKLADLYRRMAVIADKEGIPALRDHELSALQDAERTFAATQ